MLTRERVIVVVDKLSLKHSYFWNEGSVKIKPHKLLVDALPRVETSQRHGRPDSVQLPGTCYLLLAKNI
jgi:hypothetical protein